MYILLFKNNTITIDQKKEVLNDIVFVLSKKYTSEEVIKFFFGSYLKKIPIQIKDILKNTSYHANLINPIKIYYHKNLRIIPKPRTVAIDYNSGVMVGQQEEYFLETVASYTIEEIVNYFLEKDIVNTMEYTRNRLLGLFKYYINKYDIDIVLFIIEAIDHNIELRNCFNMNNFENYYIQGKAYYENCINNCIANGGNKIVPRKRMLFS